MRLKLCYTYNTNSLATLLCIIESRLDDNKFILSNKVKKLNRILILKI